jgi:hypothetical protein
MARYDLFRLPDDQGYVVDVQSNHASGMLRTRVVVPLVPVAEPGKLIGSLMADHGDRVTYALDILLTGF